VSGGQGGGSAWQLAESLPLFSLSELFIIKLRIIELLSSN